MIVLKAKCEEQNWLIRECLFSDNCSQILFSFKKHIHVSPLSAFEPFVWISWNSGMNIMGLEYK